MDKVASEDITNAGEGTPGEIRKEPSAAKHS